MNSVKTMNTGYGLIIHFQYAVIVDKVDSMWQYSMMVHNLARFVYGSTLFTWGRASELSCRLFTVIFLVQGCFFGININQVCLFLAMMWFLQPRGELNTLRSADKFTNCYALYAFQKHWLTESGSRVKNSIRLRPDFRHIFALRAYRVKSAPKTRHNGFFRRFLRAPACAPGRSSRGGMRSLRGH